MSEIAWRPPGWATKPQGGPRYLLISKDGESVGKLTLTDRALLFGRKVPNEPARGTVRLDHDSISRHHAAIVFSFTGETFVVDLGSRFGTTADGEKLVANKYTPIKEGAVIVFGGSTKSYKISSRPPKEGSDTKAPKKSKPSGSSSTAAGGPSGSKAAAGKVTHTHACLRRVKPKGYPRFSL